MGIRNFVRTRKTVKADRAGMADHAKLVAALGGNAKGATTKSFDQHANETMYIANGPSNGGVYDQAMEGNK
jgi:hypothetical protein